MMDNKKTKVKDREIPEPKSFKKEFVKKLKESKEKLLSLPVVSKEQHENQNPRV